MSKLLIIGGSKGIGAAILSQQIAQRSCINISRTHPTVQGNYLHHSLDIMEDDLPEIDDLAKIVYCPGTINLKPISSLQLEDFETDYRINVLGAVKVIKKYHRQLKRAEGSSIVLFSTVAVSQGMAYHASVAAAKGAIEGLVKSLAAEFAPHIRINAIAPTITDTPLAGRILKNDETRRKMSERHPLKRIIDPTEVASLADYLLSDRAISMSGQVIQVDAGITTIR